MPSKAPHPGMNADVRRATKAAGVRIHSFAEKEPTLEDVFMLVTKGVVG